MTTKTRETLDERAARAAAEMAQVRAEQEARARAEADRLRQHQSAIDAEIVASYDQAGDVAEVAQARAALDQAVAEHPLTQALAGYYLAAAKRRQNFDVYIGALGRQGRDISNVNYPTRDEVDLLPLIDRTAERIANDWRAQAEADWHNRYSNPGENR